MNPSAGEFKMTASASEFTPTWGAPAANPAPPVKAKVFDLSAPPKSSNPPPAVAAPAPKTETLEVKEEKPKVVAAPKPKIEEDKMDLSALDDEIAATEIENIVEAEEDDREHLSIIFVGHVDAGKSTISGQILCLTGMIDQQIMKKNEKEAKDRGRESWAIAYIMDSNEEEKAKGKTVEVGRAHFETKTKRYTILDAPGHKNYVPNMIGAAAQADVAMLVISARKGEFETGFHRAGQTREHTVLAKTLGVNHIVVVINKMDDPTVEWDKGRWDEIVGQLTTFLKQSGYDTKNNVHFVAVSGLKGINIMTPLTSDVCPWYQGGTLLSTLDNIKILTRMPDYPLRIPLIDKLRDGGRTWGMGKVETGIVSKGQPLVVVPNNIPVEVTNIMSDDIHSFRKAKPGENIKIALKGVDEEQLSRGFMICDPRSPVPCQQRFEAQVVILELLPHKALFSAGYTAVIHIHTAVEEVSCVVLLDQLDKKTGQSIKKKPDFVKNGCVTRCILEAAQPICLELFSSVPQLGRFTLRDEGKTIAIGKVTALGAKKKTTA